MSLDSGVNDTNNAIVTRGLVREFGAVKAVDGVKPGRAPGGDLRLFRPQRRRQNHRYPDADYLAGAERPGTISVAGFDAVAQPDRVRLSIGARRCKRRPWTKSRPAGSC